MISQQQPAAATEELQINVEKVISDERTLYLLYGLKANEGAVLDQDGQFADFELYFPSKMMSGAYVSRFWSGRRAYRRMNWRASYTPTGSRVTAPTAW